MRNFPTHLIFVIILLAFSGISWVYRQLKAQQALKRAKDREEQRQLEVLRTGRDPAAETHQDSAEAQRQRELAARREAQLAELRRRAQQRATQQSGEPASRPTMATPPVAPPPVPRSQPMPPPTGPATAPARIAPRQTARIQSQSQPLPAARAKSKQAARAPEPVAHHHEEIVIARPAAPVIQVNAPRTPEEWRRAIIANEIMSPPLAIREAPPSLPF